MFERRGVSKSGAIGPERLGQLIDRHGAALRLYAAQFVGDAEDVVQTALMRLVDQREAPVDPAAWLFRVVRNEAISQLRRAQRRRRHEKVIADQRRMAWFVADNGHRLEAQQATDALADLPRDSREVVVAHVWGGLSFGQIGQMIGCGRSTAHRRYHDALSVLRMRLD